MKVVIPIIAVLLIAGYAIADQAHWHGYVYYNRQVVEDATVYTVPTGGETSTDYAGFYNLCEENGMVEETYYSWVKAYKTIGTLKTGQYFADDYYDEQTPKGPMNITLSDPNK